MFTNIMYVGQFFYNSQVFLFNTFYYSTIFYFTCNFRSIFWNYVDFSYVRLLYSCYFVSFRSCTFTILVSWHYDRCEFNELCLDWMELVVKYCRCARVKFGLCFHIVGSDQSCCSSTSDRQSQLGQMCTTHNHWSRLFAGGDKTQVHQVSSL